jgi:threonyl-tRNA synthetase
VRSELDSNASTITYKIRNAEVRKIPCIALCGRREAETGEIAIRRHGFGNIGCSTTEELAKTIMKSAAKETESTTSKRF